MNAGHAIALGVKGHPKAVQRPISVILNEVKNLLQETASGLKRFFATLRMTWGVSVTRVHRGSPASRVDCASERASR